MPVPLITNAVPILKLHLGTIAKQAMPNAYYCSWLKPSLPSFYLDIMNPFLTLEKHQMSTTDLQVVSRHSNEAHNLMVNSESFGQL